MFQASRHTCEDNVDSKIFDNAPNDMSSVAVLNLKTKHMIYCKKQV